MGVASDKSEARWDPAGISARSLMPERVNQYGACGGLKMTTDSLLLPPAPPPPPFKKVRLGLACPMECRGSDILELLRLGHGSLASSMMILRTPGREKPTIRKFCDCHPVRQPSYMQRCCAVREQRPTSPGCSRHPELGTRHRSEEAILDISAPPRCAMGKNWKPN